MAFLPGQIGGVPDALLTPDQVERKRAEAALLQQQAMGGGAQNFLGALVQGLSGFQGGRMLSQADKAEAAGLASADEFVQGIPQISGGPVAPAPQSAGVPAALTGLPQEARSAPGADYIRAGLVQRGLPEHVADAFILNFQDESGLNPGINEANPIVEGSRGGFGLAQWTGPRRRQLESFAAQRGTPVSDVDTQLDFLMTELQGPESAAARKILSAGDTGSAASAIVNSFLRPAEEHRARREARYLGGATPQFSAAPTQPQSQDLSALIQASSNPWVAQKYGPAVDALLEQDMARSNAAYEAQLKQQDPMYQAQLQQQQLQNEALMNPEVDPWAGTQVINNQVVAMGEQGPQVLGDFNTVDQTAAMQNYSQLLMMGLDPQDALNRAFSGGTTVNVGGEDKFADEFAKGDAASLVGVSDAGSMAQRNLGRIDQLENLLSNSPTGLTGRAKQYAGEWGIDTEGLSDIQAAQALINSLVPEQRPAGSGPMSDADLELFKQSLPRIINTPEGNQLIIDTMRGIAQYDAEGAMIVQQLRRGELDRATAFDMLQNRVNPLANFSSGGSATGGNDAIPSGVDPSDWEYMTPEERALFQ